MSRQTEKAMKEMQEYLSAHAREGMKEEELNALLNAFMEENRGKMPAKMTEKTAVTSDDYMELAEEAENDASRLKYAKKALKLDPDNLDAELMIIMLSSRSATDCLKKLEQAKLRGDRIMEKKGLMDEDSIGHYWGILETRPYMRLRDAYVQNLVAAGMLGCAAKECEDMLRLCEMDNLGMRHTLMHLYAALEQEEKALTLLEKFSEYDETQLLLPMAMLYYKLNQMPKAEEYLKRLVKLNPDTKKFIHAFATENFDRLPDGMGPYGYRPNTIEELLVEALENETLFKSVPVFYEWADSLLRKRK